MTLGRRCFHTARIPKPKPCKGGCGVLVLTKCAAKYCDACYERHGGIGAHRGMSRDTLDPKYLDLTRAEIDATFERALAEIRRRPREATELRVRSTLSGWNL